MPEDPKHFGAHPNGPYPAEMRTQLWPLCCGARIISGFKDVHSLSVEEIVEKVNEVMTYIPDHQVFRGEQMKPAFTFLTLNSGQMASPKIMKAVEELGFFKIGVGQPRGTDQGFFLKDTSKT